MWVMTGCTVAHGSRAVVYFKFFPILCLGTVAGEADYLVRLARRIITFAFLQFVATETSAGAGRLVFILFAALVFVTWVTR